MNDSDSDEDSFMMMN